MSTNSGYLDKIQKIHRRFVLRRREDVLARNIVAMLPEGVYTALDVGCGDGIIAGLVAEQKRGLGIRGAEVMSRMTCLIPYTLFDGKILPFPDGSFDFVSIIDVLHHTDNIEELIGECLRVSSRYLIIKDHIFKNRLDFSVLRFMDWVGNRSYGVRLIYNYQKKDQWVQIFRRHGVTVVEWNDHLGLYPFPFNPVFERGKHFLALLAKR